jgi:hypothetical protein
MMIVATACTKTTKVKRLKEDGFCAFCFSFVWVLFCDGFFYYAFVKFRKFFISKNLVIIYKLSKMDNFYYNEKDFVTILVFVIVLKKYQRKKININK